MYDRQDDFTISSFARLSPKLSASNERGRTNKRERERERRREKERER